MVFRFLGAALVLLACGYVGFQNASAYRRQERTLEQLLFALEYMERELEYALPPLPDLCRRTGAQCNGMIAALFLCLAQEMDKQVAADVSCCMEAALERIPQLTCNVREKLSLLGKSLGKFDVSGQLGGIRSTRAQAKRDLDGLYAGHEERTRSYRALGLCAGAALVILFI